MLHEIGFWRALSCDLGFNRFDTITDHLSEENRIFSRPQTGHLHDWRCVEQALVGISVWGNGDEEIGFLGRLYLGYSSIVCNGLLPPEFDVTEPVSDAFGRPI